jgi:hypothetical protein
LPAGLGLARSRCEHWHRRVIGVDHAAGHDMICDQLTERAQQPRSVAELGGELAAVDLQTTTAGVDLGLTVKWQVIAELGDRDVGEEARIHHTARDRQVGHGRLHHRLALAARAGRAHVADHLEAAGNVGEDLGDALTNFAQVGATAGFAHVGRHVHDVTARQLRWQRAPLLLLLLGLL